MITLAGLDHPWTSDRKKVTISSVMACCDWASDTLGISTRFLIERKDGCNAVLILAGGLAVPARQILVLRSMGVRGKEELRSLAAMSYGQESRATTVPEGGQ